MKEKQTAKCDRIVTLYGRTYFVNQHMLPFVVLRACPRGTPTDFLVMFKDGTTQYLNTVSTEKMLEQKAFPNITSKDYLYHSDEIPNYTIDEQGNMIELTSVKKTDRGNIANRSAQIAAELQGQPIGIRSQRRFEYIDGFKSGFSYQGVTTEDFYPLIEDQYELVKREFKDKCRLKLEKISRDVKDGVAYITFSLSGKVEIGDWEVIAHLYFNEGKPLIKPLINLSQSTINDMYTIKCYCDHCNTKRDRIHTFMIRNITTGERKQIANSCMNKYFGVNALAAATAFEELLKLINPNVDKTVYADGLLYFNTKDLMASIIRSKKYYADGFTSSYHAGMFEDLLQDEKEIYDNVINWVNSLNSDLTKNHNMQVIITSETIRKNLAAEVQTIFKRYLDYCDIKRTVYEKAQTSFITMKSNIQGKIDGYAHRVQKVVSAVERHNAKIEEERRKMIESEQKKLAEWSIQTDSSSANGAEFAAYTDYTALKEQYGFVTNQQVIDIAEKYNIPLKTKYKILPKGEMISVIVTDVQLKGRKSSMYNSNEYYFIYTFTMDNGETVNWSTGEANAQKLGLPLIQAPAKKLHKKLTGVISYSNAYNLVLSRCKFSDIDTPIMTIYDLLRQPDCVLTVTTTFERKPTMPVQKPVQKERPNEINIQQIDEVIRRWYGEPEDATVKLEELKHEQEQYEGVMKDIEGVDPMTFYDIDYLNLTDKYRQWKKKYTEKKGVQDTIVFKPNRGILLRYGKTKALVVLSSPEAFVYCELNASKIESLFNVHQQQLSWLYYFMGCKLHLTDVEIKLINVQRYTADDNSKNLYLFTDYQAEQLLSKLFRRK